MSFVRPDIAVVIGSMRIGGAERATLNLINGLVKKGLKVELVMLYQTGDFLKSIDRQINIVNLNKRKASQGFSAFKDYLKKHDPEILFVVQNHIQLMALLAVSFSSWKGKIVLNEQSTFSKNLNGIKGIVQIILSRFLFQRADKITCVSEGVANDLKKRMPSLNPKIVVIPNAIITDNFYKLKDENVNHPFFSSGCPVIISAGRFIKSKNFDLLIKAFAILSIDQQAKLIILGDGEQRHHLKHLVRDLNLKDDVDFPGFVPEPCMYISKSDLFVLSSNYEGLPGVIIEALACGCKVVSTDCENGPSEILMDGKFGRLTPVGNADELAVAMRKALSSKQEKQMLIDRANDFHVDRIVSKYVELFKSIK